MFRPCWAAHGLLHFRERYLSLSGLVFVLKLYAGYAYGPVTLPVVRYCAIAPLAIRKKTHGLCLAMNWLASAKLLSLFGGTT
jgi:hypothetical protein